MSKLADLQLPGTPNGKRHLDWFSRFCGARGRDRGTRTHRPTTHVAIYYSLSVAVARVLCSACDAAK